MLDGGRDLLEVSVFYTGSFYNVLFKVQRLRIIEESCSDQRSPVPGFFFPLVPAAKRPCYFRSHKSFLSKVAIQILLMKTTKNTGSTNFNIVIIKENLLKIVFSLYCGFLSLRIRLRQLVFRKHIKACHNFGILVKKYQCNEATFARQVKDLLQNKLLYKFLEVS